MHMHNTANTSANHADTNQQAYYTRCLNPGTLTRKHETEIHSRQNDRLKVDAAVAKRLG